MSCHECQAQLVDYLLGELPAGDKAGVAAHVDQCEHCRDQLQVERRLRDALKFACPIPPSSVDFEKRVLAHATKGSARPRWLNPMTGGAIAAALILGLVLGIGIDDRSVEPQTAFMEAKASDDSALSRSQLQTIRLAFNTRDALRGVTLTLELPPNVELTRFPGQQKLSWQVDLKSGENVLALPVRVLFPGAGELVARLDDGQQQKTFRVSIPHSSDPVLEKPSS